MDIEKFDLLEKKVIKLISRVSELEMENNNLKQKYNNLLKTMEEKENILQNLKQSNQTNIVMQNKIENYQKKEDTIKSKVENLLIKLKEFDEF